MEIKLTADWILTNAVGSWHHLEDNTLDVSAQHSSSLSTAFIALALSSIGVEYEYTEGFNKHGCWIERFNFPLTETVRKECPELIKTICRGKGASLDLRTTLYEYSPKGPEILPLIADDVLAELCEWSNIGKGKIAVYNYRFESSADSILIHKAFETVDIEPDWILEQEEKGGTEYEVAIFPREDLKDLLPTCYMLCR